MRYSKLTMLLRFTVSKLGYCSCNGPFLVKLTLIWLCLNSITVLHYYSRAIVPDVNSFPDQPLNPLHNVLASCIFFECLKERPVAWVIRHRVLRIKLQHKMFLNHKQSLLILLICEETSAKDFKKPPFPHNVISAVPFVSTKK